MTTNQNSFGPQSRRQRRRSRTRRRKEAGAYLCPKTAADQYLALARCELIAEELQRRDTRLPRQLRVDLAETACLGMAHTRTKAPDDERLMHITIDVDAAIYFNDEELMALIAHEAGHFLYQASDNLWSRAFCLLTMLVGCGALAYGLTTEYLAAIIGGMTLCIITAFKLHQLNSALQRRLHAVEFECDRYAATATSPEASIKHFQRWHELSPRSREANAYDSLTHPCQHKRITRLWHIADGDEAWFDMTAPYTP